jgi:uncharacterized membrane protein YtjA (UPF0391 family)
LLGCEGERFDEGDRSRRLSADALVSGGRLDRWAARWNLLRASAFGSTLINAQRQEDIMFGWAIAFLVIALIAGLLGFGVVAGTAFAAAKIVFVVALIAFLISGVLGFTGRGIP